MVPAAASPEWFRITNEADIPSPALLVYPDRIEENVRRMVRLAGGAHRLRPHVKTYKMPQVVRMQLAAGVTRFKCATLSELVMTLGAGAKDVFLAYPVVGPAVHAVFDLRERFPDRVISALTDDAHALAAIEAAARERGSTLPVFVDINNGMGRTGIRPGPQALELYRRIAESELVQAAGLHVYDGHIHDPDAGERASACAKEFEPVQELIGRIKADALPLPELVCGGTPTFPVHARFPDRTVSPGTVLLWDHGYGSSFVDLDFLYAAVLMTRVVSKPARATVCLDLGVKALSADKPHPRVWFPGLRQYDVLHHSEEHLTISSAQAEPLDLGAVLYGVPTHICPTVALHDEVWAVRSGIAAERWPVAARGRRIEAHPASAHRSEERFP